MLVPVILSGGAGTRLWPLSRELYPKQLLSLTSQVAEATFGISSTLNFVMILLALFAIIFQLPIILVGLARLGIVNAPMLMKYRRHAFFGMIVVSGIAAPDGNPMTMLLLAVPMYVLYEISIWIIVLFARSWHRSTS